ncbi:conserved Plasmodium protein, unknown function [Plasmodium relictum]|uniref:Uncharacterized protein n=1 Tax=Plasmodium relictum TaxID=85471 RepID=A0A1J1H7G0_PLARL|nr:conserved Plasmodium protein, unknown function [Plasmodium relictum]CRG99366.1 conserved Plasmodium protein, unknown function [Plasmodium relictum]
MKNNKEIKLIYRTLNDNFFVINKPVNWTLKKKKVIRDIKFSKCSEDYNKEENKNEDTKYINVLKNLSNSEKNTFLFTNSSSYFYNNFNFNLNESNSKAKDKENVNDYKRILHNKFIEKYYLESILKCETKTDIYFPYKLPIYMSGLVICCRDYYIYKKFLQMIDENKLIRKYRCLINNPFVFIHNKRNDYKKEENAKENLKPLENKFNQNKYVNKINDRQICKKVYLSNISSLLAQKEVSEMFPFYNFFDNNSYSSSYWYNITNLEIEKLNEKLSFLLENDKRESTSKMERKSGIDTEKENNDYFINAYLKKSQPIKSLTNFFSYIFNNVINDFSYLKRGKNIIEEFEEQKDQEIMIFYNSTHKKSEKELKICDNIYNLNLKHLYNSKKRILFPLSLFFNEGNFFFFDKEISKNSLKFSMIYKIKNYKKYLEKNIFLNNEKSINYNLENFDNIFLIEFILLNNHKPDLIRFFFSETSTPIINDNIFYKNNFKNDIINELILIKENNNLHINSSIFEDKYSDNSHIFSDEKIKDYNKKYNDNLLDKYKLNKNAFTIPDDNSLNNVNEKVKLNLNNYFINETKNSIDDNDYHKYNTNKKFPKNNNLCLELYQLQFCDPINNDFIKIENSLSTSWI